MTDTVYLGPVVTLLVVAAALGINNFAGSIGIGVSGAGWAVRVRVAAVFGLFETAMPVAGLLLGRDAASGLGSATRWTGAGLLAAVGVYQLLSRRDPAADPDRWGGWRLLVTGAALSLDNLAVGFALGTVNVPVVLAVIVFGVVSIAMSLAGLELGARLGTIVGDKGRIIAGIALIAVGAAMAAGWLLPAPTPSRRLRCATRAAT
jgi:manganese efflux pump family protein